MDDFADTVRIFCKVRRKMTIGQLAQRSGIAERRLEKLIHNDPLERRQASGSELLSVWAVLGEAGASHGLAAIDMTASHTDDAGADAERLGLAVADLFDAGADVARIVADGVIDPGEAAAADAALDRAEHQVHQLRGAVKRARRK